MVSWGDDGGPGNGNDPRGESRAFFVLACVIVFLLVAAALLLRAAHGG